MSGSETPPDEYGLQNFLTHGKRGVITQAAHFTVSRFLFMHPLYFVSKKING